MKHKLLYIIPVIIVFLAGCYGSKDTPTPTLSGNFSGQFRLVHRHITTVPFDTAKANITLTLNKTASTFAVSGDTSTVIAGSKGSYQLALNGNYILFLDNTLSASSVSTKAHLNGEYTYAFDGNNLQMLATSGDTLKVEYDLNKTQ